MELAFITVPTLVMLGFDVEPVSQKMHNNVYTLWMYTNKKLSVVVLLCYFLPFISVLHCSPNHWFVLLIGTCTEETIRLIGGSSPTQGRVEVCLIDTWGTVCDDAWTDVDASVACRQLGYSRFSEKSNGLLFCAWPFLVLFTPHSFCAFLCYRCYCILWCILWSRKWFSCSG